MAADAVSLAAYRRMRSALAAPLTTVRGVGPKVAAKLARKSLHTLGDALLFFPIRYEDRTRLVTLDRLPAGSGATFRGRVVTAGVRGYARR